MLTGEVLDSIQRCVLCWLATVDAGGAPNVSPKEVFCAWGREMLLIAHIASPGSVRNVRVSPRVCVAFVDVFVQKGFKVRGTAEVVAPADPRFEALAAPLRRLAGEGFPVRAVIAVRVEAVEPIVAPGYDLVPGTTEASQVAGAMRTYGVVPAPRQTREVRGSEDG